MANQVSCVRPEVKHRIEESPWCDFLWGERWMICRGIRTNQCHAVGGGSPVCKNGNFRAGFFRFCMRCLAARGLGALSAEKGDSEQLGYALSKFMADIARRPAR